MHGTWRRMPHMGTAAGTHRLAGCTLFRSVCMLSVGLKMTRANSYKSALSTISNLGCRASVDGVCALALQSLCVWP